MRREEADTEPLRALAPAPVGTWHGVTARDWIAVIVAIGLCTAVNAITIGVLWDAIRSEGPGLSENATQVLTTAFGGMIGILGTAVGYQAGRHSLDGPPKP